MLAIGCTQPATHEDADLAGNNTGGDLAGSPTDLAGSPTDLAGSTTDLAGAVDLAGAPDLTTGMPTITSFTSAKSTITRGTATTLTAQFGGGSGTVDNGVGAVQSGVAISTGNLDTTTTFTLTVRDGGGDSATKTLTVTVVDAPVITSFTADHTTLTSGDSAKLHGVFSGGTGSVDNGVGALVSGVDQTVGPLTSTTIYTLTVTNGAGDSATAMVTITVVGAPSITSFTAGQSTVTFGHATTLSAVFSGGTGSIDQGIGVVSSGVAKSTGNLSMTTTYTLTVTNGAGEVVTQQLIITAVQPALIDQFDVGMSPITAGQSTTLTATFSHGTGSIDHGVGAVTSLVAQSTGVLTTSTTFTLTVTDPAGDSVTQQAQVLVSPAPVITSFSAARSTVSAGGATDLTAVFAGGTASVDQGFGGILNNQPTSTGPLSTTTTFTLTVTNSLGYPVTKQVVVTVVPLPSIDSFVAGKTLTTEGKTTTLTASFSGGTGFVDNGVGPVVSASPAPTLALALGDTDFKLTVTNAAGDSVQSDVLVTAVAAPHADNLVVDTGYIKKGTAEHLYPFFRNGTPTIDHGVVVPNGTVNGDGLPTQAVDQDTYWTMTVTNAAGDIDTTSSELVRVYLDDAPCKDAKIRNPAAPDGLYLLGGPYTGTLVQCDMTHDGGGWMKILQLHDQPYTPTATGAGDISTPSPTAFAKLPDSAIPSGIQEYRFMGNQTPDKLFFVSGTQWDDTHRSWNLTDGGYWGCVSSDEASCSYKTFFHDDSLDTLPVIDPNDDCTRFVVDFNGNSQCMNISDTQRCMSAGTSCGGGAGNPMIQDLTIWQRTTYRQYMMSQYAFGQTILYFPFDPSGGSANIDQWSGGNLAWSLPPYDLVNDDGTPLVQPGGSAQFDGNAFLWLDWSASFNPGDNPPDQQEFAVEAWFEVTGGSGPRAIISSRDDNGTNTMGWALYINAANHVEFWTGQDNADSWVILQDPNPVTLNQRHHVVARYDKSDKHIFLDGVDVAACTSGCLPAAANMTRPLRIGAGGTGDNTTAQDFFVGRLDEVAFYSGFRFDLERAQADYKQGSF
jgi:hypothetical protein